MQSIQRSALSRPDSNPADCRHSREAFDCAFRSINQRRDISPTAKLVHAHLVTLHRIGRDATQTEIGEALGLSRHQVWRAIGELVAVELVRTIRYGLGRPNGYVLLGVSEDDLDGRASGSRPHRQQQAGQSRSPARAFHSSKKNEERIDIRSTTVADYYQTRDHSSTDYYETRRGRLSQKLMPYAVD